MVPVPVAGPDEVLIRVTRAGLNFADTHTRTNSYVQKATLPLVPGGEVAGIREDTGERVVALVCSPDGKRIASSTIHQDRHVRLWDAATGKELWNVKDQISWAEALAFSADGKTLATGCGATARS